MVTIELNEDDALVLFEFLTRHDELDNESAITELKIDDPAELYALWQLHGVLENTLIEPLSPDYQAMVDAARAAVRIRWGHK